MKNILGRYPHGAEKSGVMLPSPNPCHAAGYTPGDVHYMGRAEYPILGRDRFTGHILAYRLYLVR